jgi:archaellum component FlaC
MHHDDDNNIKDSEIRANIAITSVNRLNRRSDKIENDISSLKSGIFEIKSEIAELKYIIRDFMTLLSNSNK